MHGGQITEVPRTGNAAADGNAAATAHLMNRMDVLTAKQKI
jgi:hypothetical protein